jgi:ribonuclease HI
MEDFTSGRERGEPALGQSPQSSGGWKAPEVGWLKANWDAAVDQPGGRSWPSGLGVVIQDSNGSMRVARCVTKQVCLHPAVAEAMALLEAFRLCRDLGIRQITFEGDAKGIVDAVFSDEVDRGWMGHMIADLKQDFGGFQNSLISYVKRDNNRAAHLLARGAAKFALNNTWLLTPPAWLLVLLTLYC